MDVLEEHYGDDDFYFDMGALQAAEAPESAKAYARAMTFAGGDPVPGKAPLPRSPRAEKADWARDAAFAAAREFVEAVVGSGGGWHGLA